MEYEKITINALSCKQEFHIEKASENTLRGHVARTGIIRDMRNPDKKAHI